jgi:UDP-N-acetylmuramate--alanine ligase
MSFEGRKFHLIGIGGAGMSGLAIAANQLGAAVSGSDRSASSYTERLQAAGVTVFIGHDAANLPEGAEVVISTAIGEDNPELAAARANGVPVLHRSDLLAELVALKPKCIAVAGTHGKTTTTAMVAHVLHELGEQPSFFVGGEVSVGGSVTNAFVGEGDVVVVEADESDGSFLKLKPQVAVITNVELDHHASWGGGLEELLAAFKQFAQPADSVVVWRSQTNLAELGTVGFAIGSGDEGDVVAENVETPADPDTGSIFTLDGEKVQLGVRGDHNVLNALAALAALREVGIPIEDAAPELATFTGVARRFEHVGTSELGAEVYDDYAHHPTEVRAALTTAQATSGDGRVVAVFQPHLFSRTQSLAREFGRALAIADIVVVMGIYPARELQDDFPGITGWLVATATADASKNTRVFWEPAPEDAFEALRTILRPGDLCMTVGAGDVFKVGRQLVGKQ